MSKVNLCPICKDEHPIDMDYCNVCESQLIKIERFEIIEKTSDENRTQFYQDSISKIIGKNFASISLKLAPLSILMPLIFGPLSIVFGIVAVNNGASQSGHTAIKSGVYFMISSIILWLVVISFFYKL